jgi:hypothetical protein
VWLRFWLGRSDGAAGAVPLGSVARELALEEQMPRYGPTDGQALGWAIRFDPSARVFGHGGLSAGYCSYTLFAPDLDLAAVVQTNSTSGAGVHSELTRWLVGEIGGVPWSEPEPLRPQPEDLSRYAGIYWHSFGTTRVSSTPEGELLFETTRHSTEDGAWPPPPGGPLSGRLIARDHTSVTTPGPEQGSILDFDPGTRPGGLTPDWGTPCGPGARSRGVRMRGGD